MKDLLAQGKGIEIRKLTKTFGDKTAVNQLSMNIFSNQITALLGANGAGKVGFCFSSVVLSSICLLSLLNFVTSGICTPPCEILFLHRLRLSLC
ncbi:ABC transporter, ATP-binding protein [Nitzschia inconspicua]|uniref:ABC transporter, ATP-binding protein n=1 Tax=Nitzschia inconspicua TaxID=303405 RepID=A0A9K3LST9_9STRA|nr:ABC transporter, ATP-binding protein [Nitzschia inconspicua]